MIRLSLSSHLFTRITYNETIFHTRRIKKSSQHILVASFTQSSVPHQIGDYIKKLNPFEDKKDKEVQSNEEKENDEENDLDNSEHVVMDKLKPILKDDDVIRFKKITDPNEIKESIFSIVQKYIESAKGDLMQLELEDAKLKFEILRDSTKIIGKQIPNLELNKINTVKDAIDFFIKEEDIDQRKGHPVAEWFIKHKDKLPPNMSFIPYVKERGVKREDRSKWKKF